MTFTQWLEDQVERQDAVGEFARDAMQDDDWPQMAVMKSSFGFYLTQSDASLVALNVLDDAWAEFQQRGIR